MYKKQRFWMCFGELPPLEGIEELSVRYPRCDFEVPASASTVEILGTKLTKLPSTVTTISCDDNLRLVPLSAHTYVAYPNRKHEIPDFIPKVILRNFRERVWSKQELRGLPVQTINCPMMNY